MRLAGKHVPNHRQFPKSFMIGQIFQQSRRRGIFSPRKALLHSDRRTDVKPVIPFGKRHAADLIHIVEKPLPLFSTQRFYLPRIRRKTVGSKLNLVCSPFIKGNAGKIARSTRTDAGRTVRRKQTGRRNYRGSKQSAHFPQAQFPADNGYEC